MTIQEKVKEVAAKSPYGWGHTMNFGDFTMPGILGDLYLGIVERLDSYGWLPQDLTRQRVADIGCFSGGITKILAERNPNKIFAVDEIPEHLEQCKVVIEAFNLQDIVPVEASLYWLRNLLPICSLNLIVCGGVLYHCTDMMTALYTMRELLLPDGVLLLETNAIDDDQRSYANFGRFYSGMWWQPTSLCIADMCEFTGFNPPEIKFYDSTRCLVKATRHFNPIPFRRGMNYKFNDIHDQIKRHNDPSVMRKARD